MDVQIGTITTKVTVSEGVGALSPEDVQQIVKLVMEHLHQQQHQEQQRQADVAIHDRVYRKKGL